MLEVPSAVRDVEAPAQSASGGEPEQVLSGAVEAAAVADSGRAGPGSEALDGLGELLGGLDGGGSTDGPAPDILRLAEGAGLDAPATAVPTPRPAVVRPPVEPKDAGPFVATRYGESYNGSTLGCGGGVYSSADVSILAAPPAKYSAWPCGTVLRITNPANGRSIVVRRADSCPGCAANHVDLSEAGIAALGGRDYLSGLIIEPR